MKRMQGESFEEYKARRATAGTSTKDYLKGQVVKPMSAMPRIVRAYKRLEKLFDTASPLAKPRIMKKASKLEAQIKNV